MSSARSLLSACRNRRPSSSPFKSVDCNEALLVSYSAMHTTAAGANFEAVDRVVRIVRELDRYHGFAAVPRPREEPEARRLPRPLESPLALEGPGPSDLQIAPQAVEKARFGLANAPLPGARREKGVLPDAREEG